MQKIDALKAQLDQVKRQITNTNAQAKARADAFAAELQRLQAKQRDLEKQVADLEEPASVPVEEPAPATSPATSPKTTSPARPATNKK
jgi:chromosome segregation ATPase